MALIVRDADLSPQQRSVRQFQQQATSLYTHLKAAYLMGHNLLWKNPNGLTPPEAFAAFGTDVGAIFAQAQKMAEMLALVGESVPAVPAGWSYTIHPDGSGAASHTPPASPAQ